MLILAVIRTELAVQLINFATSVDSIKKPITLIFSDVALMTGTIMMCPKNSKLQSSFEVIQLSTQHFYTLFLRITACQILM